jgi:hypothetical protein
MSINSIIKTTLAPVTSEIEPDVYSGTADEYFTFNYFSQGDDFADDAPQHERYNVQIHYVCPRGKNSLSIRKQIKQLLFGAGFTWPTVTDATDSDGQHWIFECEYLMGV